MMWKTLLFTLLAVGALAQEYKVTDDQRQQLKNLLKEECTKAGNPDKAEDVEKSGKQFVDCLKELINIETLTQEIEAAKPNGALDEVFKKYCNKSPQFKTCIHNLVNNVSPCLSTELRGHLDTVNNGTDQLIDFVCYKDGDRIALFIAEGGPDCFREKADKIRICAEDLKKTISSVEEAKQLTPAQRCSKFDVLTQCIVTALEECSTPTPGNMAESLFRFLRKGFPCN